LELLEACNAVDMSKGAKYFQIAKSCSNLMLFLSNDILDFAQLESKQLVLNMRDDVEVRTVVSECVGLLSLKAETKGI
jgi:signal transduction histidine kinase